MSTILKALRRLEEDKRAEAALGLDHVVLDPVKPHRGTGLAASVGAGVAAALGVIAIVWSLSGLWTQGGDAEGPAMPVASAASPVAPVSIRDAPRPPPTTPIPLVAPSAESRVAATGRRQRTLAVDEPTSQRLAVTSVPVAAPVEREEPPAPARDAIPEPVQQIAALAKPEPMAKLQPIVESEPAVKPVLEPRSVAPPAPPPVATRPPPVVAKVSASPAKPKPEPQKIDLAVRKIIWHPTPGRRVAVVSVEGEAEPRRIGEGEVVAGFTVAKIGLSDVELVRDGASTRKRVGAE